MAHIIVVGNEKGGAGKSTLAMPVATLDLDLRQRPLGRHIESRARLLARTGLDLPSPRDVPLSAAEPPPGTHADDHRLAATMAAEAELVVIDCPGSHIRLAQVADTPLTPLNDSLVDFDLLARIDSDGETILGPSVYAEMVWQARQMRAGAGPAPIDRVVLRTRLGSQAMTNKRRMDSAPARLARRIGVRVGPGFAERVAVRELYPARAHAPRPARRGRRAALHEPRGGAPGAARASVHALGLPGVSGCGSDLARGGPGGLHAAQAARGSWDMAVTSGPAAPAQGVGTGTGLTTGLSTSLTTGLAGMGARSLLAAGARLVGDLTVPGLIELVCEVEGRVEAQSVVIGEGGVVRGEVGASSVAIRGAFHGTLTAGAVRLHATARVSGTILYESLAIDEGAEITATFQRAAGPA